MVPITNREVMVAGRALETITTPVVMAGDVGNIAGKQAGKSRIF